MTSKGWLAALAVTCAVSACGAFGASDGAGSEDGAAAADVGDDPSTADGGGIIDAGVASSDDVGPSGSIDGAPLGDASSDAASDVATGETLDGSITPVNCDTVPAGTVVFCDDFDDRVTDSVSTDNGSGSFLGSANPVVTLPYALEVQLPSASTTGYRRYASKTSVTSWTLSFDFYNDGMLPASTLIAEVGSGGHVINLTIAGPTSVTLALPSMTGVTDTVPPSSWVHVDINLASSGVGRARVGTALEHPFTLVASGTLSLDLGVIATVSTHGILSDYFDDVLATTP